MLGGLNMERAGPGMWYFWHWSAARADTKAKVYFILDLMHAFEIEGPCRDCSEHFGLLLRDPNTVTRIESIRDEHDDVKRTRKLVRLLFHLHNCVNHRLGKPVPSFDDVLDEYSPNVAPVSPGKSESCTDACPIKRRKMIDEKEKETYVKSNDGNKASRVDKRSELDQPPGCQWSSWVTNSRA